MKIMTNRCAAIVGLMAISLATPAFAQQLTNGATVFVNFTNAPDGIYDPYTGIVSLTSGGTAINVGGQIVCDDAAHEISQPETWQGIAYSVSQLTLAELQSDGFHFGGPTGGIGLVGYAEVAIVANALLNLPGGASALDGDLGLPAPGLLGSLTDKDLSLAIWNITNGNSTGGDTNADALVTYLGSHTLSTALAGDTNLWIIVPDGVSQSNQSLGVPQEMLFQVSVPEGGTTVLYLLLSGSVCFGAIRIGSRNRIKPRASA